MLNCVTYVLGIKWNLCADMLKKIQKIIQTKIQAIPHKAGWPDVVCDRVR
jgi:hypothetical protein